MSRLKNFAVILTAILFVGYTISASAQSSKPVPPENNYYSLSSSTSINDNTLTKTQPNWPQPTAEQQNVLNQLNQARANGDVVRAQELYQQFSALHGSAPVQLAPNPRAQSLTPINPKIGGPQPDYNLTNIFSNSRPTQSVAVATVPTGAPNAGRIWVAVAVYSGSQSDTIALFYSDNGGVTFSFFTEWWFINYNMDYNAQENDIEIVYDGTSVWLFGVAGFIDNTNSRKWVAFYRFNTTTFSFAENTLGWPGNGTATNLYYNPRITSDNAEYTANSYIYMTCSFDSTTASGHITRQKYALIIAPFAASMSINFAQPSGLPLGYGGGFYWWSGGLAAGTYIWQDICHYQPGANRIMTVYNIDAPLNGHNMYLAWSDDYGATSAGNLILTENNESQWGRIAAMGGGANQHVMITYRRQYLGTDWDPYYQYTTTGGITLGAWTNGYVDASTSEAWYCDVTAVRGSTLSFKAAYIQDITVGVPAGYYDGWNGTAWTNPVPTQINNAPIDNVWGRVRAGYRYGTTDDCIAIWCAFGGNGANASRLCQTTLGIGNNNNEIPHEYNLAQNYPNPFNPTTLINFSLPNSGLVKLVVYDLLGKEVKTLVNEVKSAGNYSVTFDASSIPSGVYFYKLTSGSFVSTKKMALVK